MPSAPCCRPVDTDPGRPTRGPTLAHVSVVQAHVGDVCGVLSPVDYQRLVIQGPPRAFTIRGHRGIYGYTEHNAGVFCANTGHAIQIEHGVMGVIPLLLMANPPVNWYGEGPYLSGMMLNVPDEIVVVIQHGVLTLAMGYDRRFVLDTRTPLHTDGGASVGVYDETDDGMMPMPTDNGVPISPTTHHTLSE